MADTDEESYPNPEHTLRWMGTPEQCDWITRLENLTLSLDAVDTNLWMAYRLAHDVAHEVPPGLDLEENFWADILNQLQSVNIALLQLQRIMPKPEDAARELLAKLDEIEEEGQ